MIDPDTIDSIIDNILEMDSIELRKENEITLVEYSKRAGISRTAAAVRLNGHVEEGKLGTVLRLDPETRRRVRVWWLINP